MLMTMIMPKTRTTASVMVNGAEVAVIEKVKADAVFVGFDGKSYMGDRWLPQGVPSHIEGPRHKAEGAALALALAGYDHADVIKSLGLGSGQKGKEVPV